jgi:hypothetical protein
MGQNSPFYSKQEIKEVKNCRIVFFVNLQYIVTSIYNNLHGTQEGKFNSDCQVIRIDVHNQN